MNDKPSACLDCGAPHPSWSITGPMGPWRCMSCHTVAAANLAPPLPVRVEPAQTPANPQGSLL